MNQTPNAPALAWTVVYVAAAFAHAVERGATPRVEPTTKPWGQVSSYVADLDGNLNELASTVPR